MPPRKKAKGSVRAASAPVPEEEDTPMPDVRSSPPTIDILKDPWTDEQETSLFKGIMKWKPVGMHKHFRMVALSLYMRNHGYDPLLEEHTRIPGIWQKLHTLYDLESLDERENYFGDEIGENVSYVDFELPNEEFGERKMERVLREADEESEAASSPRHWNNPSMDEVEEPEELEELPEIKKGKRRREGTVEDTDDARSSPARSLPTRSGRRGRGRGGRGGRSERGEESSRAPSTQATEDEVEEETEEGDAEDGEDEGTPSVKATRGKRKAEAPATRKSRRTKV